MRFFRSFKKEYFERAVADGYPPDMAENASLLMQRDLVESLASAVPVEEALEQAESLYRSALNRPKPNENDTEGPNPDDLMASLASGENIEQVLAQLQQAAEQQLNANTKDALGDGTTKLSTAYLKNLQDALEGGLSHKDALSQAIKATSEQKQTAEQLKANFRG